MGPEVSSSQPYCPPGRLFRRRDHATQKLIWNIYISARSFETESGRARVAVFPDADGPQTDPLSPDVQTENVVQAIQIPPWGPEEGRAMRVWALPLCNMS
jgi:hypothetical protein